MFKKRGLTIRDRIRHCVQYGKAFEFYRFQKRTYMSFFRYIKSNRLLIWIVIIPFITFILLLTLLLITIFPNSTLIINLITTFIGILITVTLITFVLKKEDDKIYSKLKSDIYDEIESNICDYLWHSYNNYLASNEQSQALISDILPDPHPITLELPYQFPKKEIAIIESIWKLLEMTEKKNAEEYMGYKLKLVQSLKTILDKQRHILEYEVVENLESLCAQDFFSLGYVLEKTDPGGDMMHKGIWMGELYNDIKVSFEHCIKQFRILKCCRKDILDSSKKR